MRSGTRIAAARLCLLAVLVACSSTQPAAEERFEYRQRHMGTEARMVLYAPDSVVAQSAAAAAFARIAEIDHRLSDYRVDSEVSRIADAGTSVMPASDDLIAVLSCALAIASETDGAFDPTAGAAVALWRQARETGTLPDPARTREALARTGWRNVAIDTVARTVQVTAPGIRLDFGGIAKGWAADQALVILRSRGVHRALIEFGGEIVAGGSPPGAAGWSVRIGNGTGDDTVLLENGAISTSGPAEQFVEIDGIRYSHVVDPRTAIGLTSGKSATVQAPAGWLADALATAATVMDSAGVERLRAAHPGALITIR